MLNEQSLMVYGFMFSGRQVTISGRWCVLVLCNSQRVGLWACKNTVLANLIKDMCKMSKAVEMRFTTYFVALPRSVCMSQTTLIMVAHWQHRWTCASRPPRFLATTDEPPVVAYKYDTQRVQDDPGRREGRRSPIGVRQPGRRPSWDAIALWEEWVKTEFTWK
jgi:hypothetical protein